MGLFYSKTTTNSFIFDEVLEFLPLKGKKNE